MIILLSVQCRVHFTLSIKKVLTIILEESRGASNIFTGSRGDSDTFPGSKGASNIFHKLLNKTMKPLTAKLSFKQTNKNSTEVNASLAEIVVFITLPITRPERNSKISASGYFGDMEFLQQSA